MTNSVARWQIITEDPESHSAFYRDLFGWEISANNALNYRQVSTGESGGLDGGFWPAPPGAPTFVQLFVRVENVEVIVGRASEQGGAVLVPPQHLPGGEVMAILRDSVGMSFGVYSESSGH